MEVRLPAVLTHAQANTCAKALQAALRMGQSGPAVVVNASALRQFDSSALAVRMDGGLMMVGELARAVVREVVLLSPPLSGIFSTSSSSTKGSDILLEPNLCWIP